MRMLTSAKYALSVTAAVAVLAACSGGSGSQVAPGGNSVVPNGAHQVMGGNHKVGLSTLVTPPRVKPNFHNVPFVHQVKPNCCARQKTLFITDAFGGTAETGAVYMFDYKTGASLGTLAQPPETFLEPQGACTDKSGNVYIVNTEESTVNEYDHSGTFITALADPGQFPVGCASDRSTGNLAVSNIIDTSGGPGSVSIYSGGVLQNTYFPPNMFRVYFVGYEAGTGTLWLDGADSSGFFQYDSFSGGTFTPVAITGGTIAFPGTVQWSAQTKTMNVGDQDTFSAPTFYHVDDTGAITGSTVTTCTQVSDFCDIVQATIKGPGLVGPDSIGVVANRFPYPGGGAANLNYGASYVQPIGSTVSPEVP